MNGQVITSLDALRSGALESRAFAEELLLVLGKLQTKNAEVLTQWEDENVKRYLLMCEEFTVGMKNMTESFYRLQEYCNRQYAIIQRYLEV